LHLIFKNHICEDYHDEQTVQELELTLSLSKSQRKKCYGFWSREADFWVGLQKYIINATVYDKEVFFFFMWKNVNTF